MKFYSIEKMEKIIENTDSNKFKIINAKQCGFVFIKFKFENAKRKIILPKIPEYCIVNKNNGNLEVFVPCKPIKKTKFLDDNGVPYVFETPEGGATFDVNNNEKIVVPCFDVYSAEKYRHEYSSKWTPKNAKNYILGKNWVGEISEKIIKKIKKNLNISINGNIYEIIDWINNGFPQKENQEILQEEEDDFETLPKHDRLKGRYAA